MKSLRNKKLKADNKHLENFVMKKDFVVHSKNENFSSILKVVEEYNFSSSKD
ncbi:MAG: hypothetical protein KAS69_05090 [Planctomycetes bacterium]|nr:hypothetical protein [Planctomycetota bacterium]